ncbi:MAG: 23S rRNA (adenine(2030)-N(6))-methyltransferase RlmJ [Proteobacteria bacterium]|nr:23S rRNA (adenine(2030)-N(6))-methyltransferase RlmJ [Burkholderiales bacterium]
MLSYRHAYHAGNHADVLKHLVLVQLLGYLAQKDKPFWYVDTHAGAGLYPLDSVEALKNAEFEGGIGRLWRDFGLSAMRTDSETSPIPLHPQSPHVPSTALPAALSAYLAQVRALNPGGRLTRYPGSPQIARQMLRAQDRLRLFDLHSTDSRLLRAQIADVDARVIAVAGDGFAGLRSVLPPPTRRALVLIDPSYEDKQDYRDVVSALDDALRRFASGTYLVWHPLLDRRDSVQLPNALKALRDHDWLHVVLQVKTPAAHGFGMHGSGLFIVNPPWTLPDALREAMPVLVSTLGEDAGASFTLEHTIV